MAIGDRIKIRNNELIPADAILLNGDAQVDFSFVTGESDPIKKVVGEIIYAGGRQKGANIELEVSKKVSQSYLTQLWNNETFAKNTTSNIQSFQQVVSKYFTIALLIIAFGSAAFWLVVNPSLSLNAFTAVLIIACPCALALSSPFALGTAMRVLGRNKFYIKSPAVVEQMAHMDTLVFDKTGTLTQPSASSIVYFGKPLSVNQIQIIAAVVSQSIHPLSQKIKSYLGIQNVPLVTSFKEIPGKGMEAKVNDNAIVIGSQNFVGANQNEKGNNLATRVYIKIDNLLLGFFEMEQGYRKGLADILTQLAPSFNQYLLSGDNDKERDSLRAYFKQDEKMFFNQSPADKLNFIHALQQQNKKVVMIGDGLNDAGALKAAHVGISVTENTAHFSPASDVIMDAGEFLNFPKYFDFARNTLKVIHISFVISLIYNILGLSFAVQGTLSPLFAAVLMPISSVTVIVFTTLTTTFFAKKGGLQ